MPNQTDTRTTPRPDSHRNHPARRAARAYAAKCWWASYEDLVQEAFIATIKAARTFDPEHGAPIDAYLYRAAVLTLQPVLLRASAPVSAPRRKLDQLRGVTQATHPAGPLHFVSEGGQPGLAPEVLALRAPDNCEVLVDLHMWRERVRTRMTELLSDAQHTHITIPILLDGAESYEVAEREGLPLKDVYNATNRARRRLAKDLVLWRLWKDMPV